MKKRSAEVVIKVPFHDTDPMGVVWHGNYFRYFEVARCELLDSIGYNYRSMTDSGYTWPVVDTRVKYIRSAVFEQSLRVLATLDEYENRLKLSYLVSDAESGEVITKGYTIQVAVNNATSEMCFRSPKVLFERLGLEELY
ncbi:acyl-CoA thioester hydrolase [Sinobacterium caligoides]|uniref:Acyl-CoA thioester hydrolase n=1 Tax=Sinobacterium caligoides TaxID=933926 RepID=A0A3N2DP49_9GAMM|nr:thioesterase family protein [Sinobacterium caligoides]ROS01583.1 acyl-CoA thioester hydrolase [Sinobacterium caligoides]